MVPLVPADRETPAIDRAPLLDVHHAGPALRERADRPPSLQGCGQRRVHETTAVGEAIDEPVPIAPLGRSTYGGDGLS